MIKNSLSSIFFVIYLHLEREVLMKNIFVVGVLVFFIAGCATISYLPSKANQSYTPTDSVEILYKEPQKEYITLGKVIAETTGGYGNKEEMLFKKLKEKAMNIGADAVLMDNPSKPYSVWSLGYRLEGLAIKWPQK